MKILISGGSGFIGTRLIDELEKENHEIIIYDKVISIKYLLIYLKKSGSHCRLTSRIIQFTIRKITRK